MATLKYPLTSVEIDGVYYLATPPGCGPTDRAWIYVSLNTYQCAYAARDVEIYIGVNSADLTENGIGETPVGAFSHILDNLEVQAVTDTVCGAGADDGTYVTSNRLALDGYTWPYFEYGNVDKHFEIYVTKDNTELFFAAKLNSGGAQLHVMVNGDDVDITKMEMSTPNDITTIAPAGTIPYIGFDLSNSPCEVIASYFSDGDNYKISGLSEGDRIQFYLVHQDIGECSFGVYGDDGPHDDSNMRIGLISFNRYWYMTGPGDPPEIPPTYDIDPLGAWEILTGLT